MKNKEARLANRTHEVARMLFYTKTVEDIYPDKGYWMSGNRINVLMQNLDRDFTTIKAQLDGILEKYYGICVV